jgi:hypothetical protein
MKDEELPLADREYALLIQRMPYGVDRRKAILKLLDGCRLFVNREHAALKLSDPDIKYLLKKKAIRTFRVGSFSFFNENSRTTYITRVER